MAIRRPVVSVPEDASPTTALAVIPTGDTLDADVIPPSLFPGPGTSLEVPTYAEAVDRIWGAGKLSGLDISDGGGGLIDVSAGEVLLRIAASRTAAIEAWPVAAATGLALTDLVTNWVFVDYNGGTPVIGVTTTEALINELSIVTIGVVYRSGTTLAWANVDDRQVDTTARIIQLFEDVYNIQRTIGSALVSDPTPPSLKVAISSGAWYHGISKVLQDALDTSAAGVFSYWYRDGGGGWTEVVSQTDIDNTQFDDGSGTLAALGATRYNNAWVYIQLADNIDTFHVVYGRENALNQSTAIDAGPPGDIPPLLQEIGIFIGRWVIQQANGTPITIDSAFEQTFNNAAIQNHNDLGGLQGGLPNERNHLSNADVAAIAAHFADLTIHFTKASINHTQLNAGASPPVAAHPPAGGTAGQVLTKIDGTDYNFSWQTPAGGAIEVVQARRAASFTYTGAWQDITLDNTDEETNAAVVEHNNTNTDDIDLKSAGLYRFDLDISHDSAEQSNESAHIEARARIDDTTVVPGSFKRTTIINDSSFDEWEMLDNSLHGHCYYVSAGSEKVTLQLQKADLGASAMTIDTLSIEFSATFLG